MTSLTEVAKARVAECGEDRRMACQRLAEDIAADPSLLMPIAELAARQLVGQRLSADRKAIITRAQSISDRDRVLQAELAATNLWMDFPLMCGTRLGDATRQEVTATAERYLKLGRANTKRGRFLQSVAQAVTGKKKVRQVLTEDQINLRWKSIELDEEELA